MKPPRRKFTIGRDPNCDIRIADDSVSRIHAELTVLEDGTAIVRDCGSSNGTRLIREGVARPLLQETIRSSDRVQFGEASVEAADLLAGIGQKPPERASPPRPAPATPKGTRLVRCACGTIKAFNQPCPECGQ